MDIIKRLILGWDGEDEYGKYQYIYYNNCKRISLVYLECRGGKFMWETFGSGGLRNIYTDRRFDTKEEAEELIRETLLGDDLKDLVEWKIAKKNIIIQE